MIKLYEVNKINYSKNLPIDNINTNSDESAERVYLAAQYLNDMINNKNCQVLIFSETSHTRATTVLIAYLHLYKKHPMWVDFQILSDFVGSEFDQNLPNLELLQKVEQI